VATDSKAWASKTEVKIVAVAYEAPEYNIAPATDEKTAAEIKGNS
jgi:hypothetical protein